MVFDHGEAVEIRTSSTALDWISATYDYPSTRMDGWHWVRLGGGQKQTSVPDARIRKADVTTPREAP